METLIAILIPILIEIESGGNPMAIGDSGNAVGILQIWEPYWKDGTEYLGVNWPYEEAKDPSKSMYVALAYLYKYGNYYERVTGKKVSIEVLAAIHCAGPDGWRQMNEPKVATYLKKVKNHNLLRSSKMEKYIVIRTSQGIVRAAYVKDEKQGFEEVPHVVYHSPTGMEFGYGGSGPADLALSILVHFFKGDIHRADRLHQQFKRDFIAVPAKNELVIEADKIREWVEAHESACQEKTGS